MTKSEIEQEIADQEAILNSNAPDDEKEFAKSEIAELKEKLAEFKEEAKEEAKAEKIIEKEIPKSEEKKEELVEKLEEIVANPAISEPQKSEAREKIEKIVSSEEFKILDEIAEQEAIIASDAPKDEKDFAEEELKTLRAKLAVIQEETPAGETEKKKRGRTKGWRKVKAEAPIAEKKIAKKPARKAKKAATEPIVKREAKPTKASKTYDGLKINKLLARSFSRALNDKGVGYAILGTYGKHTVYIISHASQLNKAYDIYEELADENDVKVKKSETITKF